MRTKFFPKQLSEFAFFIRTALIGTVLTAFTILLLNLFGKNLAGNMLWMELGFFPVFIGLKSYHIIFVTAPRLRNVGLEPGFAALSLIPFINLAVYILCCLAPARWWQQVTCKKPPPLPGLLTSNNSLKENLSDEY